MIIKLGLLSAFALTAAFAATAPGCDNVERIYNCTEICGAYDECVDDDLDNEECVRSCEDRASESEAFEDQADDCQACIDDRSCVEAAFACGTECAGIVP